MANIRKRFSYDILTNAKDSLTHAISHIREDGDSPSKWKIAIREVSHVIELLLKERLHREHPAFIWVRVEDLNNDEARTVTLDEAQIRLERICKVILPESAIKTLAACKKLRNKIEHHQFELDEAGAKAIVGRLLSFILHFTRQNLKVDWETELKIAGAWETLAEISEFWDEHRPVIIARMKEENLAAWECPNCGAETFSYVKHLCELCHHKEKKIPCSMCNEINWQTDLSPSDSNALRKSALCEGCLETIQENASEYYGEDPTHDYY